jgi:NADH-quinone oxidoreductase subunit E
MSFEFSKENLKEADKILSKYPAARKKSAVMPLLDLAQRQNNNHISKEAIEYISNILDLPEIKVYEVATFYTMYNLKPVGKFLLQICGTTPCMLRGSEDLIKFCKEKFNIGVNDTSDDGYFTLKEVECLGACVNAPVVQINDDYFEDLTVKNFERILDDLKNGKTIKIGSQTGRQCSQPI